MRILALESSAGPASAALMEDGNLIASAWQKMGLTHSETLLPMTENLVKSAKLAFSDIDLFAISKGPGSFTGLRIGISVVKGLAMATEKPCVGISTLEGMYAALVSPMRDLFAPRAIAVCAMDARVHQVYNANFDLADGSRLTCDRAIALDDLCAELTSLARPVIVFGDGAHLVGEALQERGFEPRVTVLPEPYRYQSAVGIAAAASKLDASAYLNAGALRPEYLRLPQAERERLERLKKESHE